MLVLVWWVILELKNIFMTIKGVSNLKVARQQIRRMYDMQDELIKNIMKHLAEEVDEKKKEAHRTLIWEFNKAQKAFFKQEVEEADHIINQLIADKKINKILTKSINIGKTEVAYLELKPKYYSRVRYSETFGVLHFITTFLGVNITFGPMHLLGIAGMPRRIADYPDAFLAFNKISSFGSILTFFSTIVWFMPNLFNIRALYRKLNYSRKYYWISLFSNVGATTHYLAEFLYFIKWNTIRINVSYVLDYRHQNYEPRLIDLYKPKETKPLETTDSN